MKARIKATDNLWFDVEAEQEDDLSNKSPEFKKFSNMMGVENVDLLILNLFVD